MQKKNSCEQIDVLADPQKGSILSIKSGSIKRYLETMLPIGMFAEHP